MKLTIKELKTRFTSWKTPTGDNWNDLIDTLSGTTKSTIIEVDDVSGDVWTDVNNQVPIQGDYSTHIFVLYGGHTLYQFTYDKERLYGLGGYPTRQINFVGVMHIIDGGTGSGVLLNDVEVIGVGTVGAVDDGDVFNKDSNLTDVLTQLVQKVVLPLYTQPTIILHINPGAIQEIGSPITYTLDPRFTQNDAGAMTLIRLYKNNVLLTTQSHLNDFPHTGQIVQAGTQTYKQETDYNEGPIKDDNFGNPIPAGRVEAGTISYSRHVNGAYYNWYGEFGSTRPVDGTEIRSNASSTFNHTFTLNTGDTALVHVISCPSTNSLTKVIDVDALNLDVTDNYVLDGTITSMPDGGGNSASYKVYVSENAEAFPSNHRHNVTIS